MIHYDLRCADGHAFDGWFRDSAAFEAQAARGLLECPICGSGEVQRALMAPALTKRGRKKKPQAEPPSPAPANAATQPPAQLRAALQRLRSEVERHCDYVGPDFANEARRIHRGEIEPRGIYGETTSDQAESLADEGIEVSRIPWIDRADS